MQGILFSKGVLNAPSRARKIRFLRNGESRCRNTQILFQPAISGRLLDPCAGEGMAASILAKALNCQSWGVELSPVRATLASEKMDRLLEGEIRLLGNVLRGHRPGG